MALVLADRVKELTSTTGTGTISLNGAETAFRSFASAVGDGNTTYYAIVSVNGSEFEVGIGTITAGSPDTLSRDTVLTSSNNGSLVNFSSGSKKVFCTQPSAKAVFLDASGNIASITTTQLSEGNNLYFTDERVDDRVAAFVQNGTGISFSYDDANGTFTPTITLSPFDTDNLSEGSSNLYYTNARARAALSGGTGVTYNSSTGEIAIGQAVSTSSDVTFNDVNISGDLTVSGSQTIVNTETIELADNQIVLNSNYTGSNPTENGGIEIERGTLANKTLVWDETNDKWTVGSETFVAATFEGNLTGNVTGTVSDISNHDTGDLAEGTNLYYTDARFDTRLSSKTTDNLTEGSNLYFTDERVDDRVSNLIQNGTGISWSYDDVNGTFTPTISLASFSTSDLSEGTNLYYTSSRFDSAFSGKSTTDLSEGTNLYFTDERVDDRVSSLLVAGDNVSLSYDDVANTLTISATEDNLSNNTTDDLAEGSTNLYYTAARFNSAFAAKSTSDLSEGTNLYYTDARFDTRLATKTTSDLSEGTNLYFTNERVDDRVANLLQDGTGISFTYDDSNNVLTPTVTLSPFTTTNLSEGTNLYFTNERVDDRVANLLTAGSNITLTYDDVAGTLTIAGVEDDLSNNDTDDLSEGATNLYFTNERVDDRVASLVQNGTGISWSYNDVSGTLTPTVSLSAFSTSDLSEGTNLYYTTARFDSAFSGKSTSDLSEGTNLYYTTARFDTAFSGKTTDNLTEGSTNLYYTDTRANAAIDARVTQSFVNALNVTAAGVQANSVALGTDTTGNYIATIAGTANKITVTGSGSESAAVTLTLPDDVQIANDLTVAGDLTVNGSTTTLGTTNLEVSDNLFELNAGLTTAPVNDSGMLIQRGTSDNAIFMWDESADKFTLGTTTSDATVTGNIVITTGSLVANLEGNVTGNVTGTVSSLSNHDTGDLAEGTNLYYTDARSRAAISASGDISYNSSTGVISFTQATAPVTSVNTLTGAVVLDTDDISEGVSNLYYTAARFNSAFAAKSTTDLSEGTNLYLTQERVEDYVGGMVTGNTETGIAVTYDDTLGKLNFVIDTLNQDTTGNAATATALQTARNFSLTGDVTASAVSFDGTANVALSTSIAANTVGITELNVTDGTNGQVLTTDGAGSLSFSSISGYSDSDVESYLDGGTSTPTFASATVSGDLTVDTNTLYVNSSGNKVGIGNTSPQRQLTVGSGTGSQVMSIYAGSTSASALHFTDTNTATDYQGFVTYDHVAEGLRFGAAEAEGMRLTSTGLGIGTISPSALLHVAGDARIGAAGATSQLMGMVSSGGVFEITTSSSVGKIHLARNVGIGTSSPSSTLHLQAAANSDTTLTITGGVTPSLGSNAIIKLIPDGTSGEGVIDVDGSDGYDQLELRTGGTTALTVDGSQNVGIGTSSPLAIGGHTGVLTLYGSNATALALQNSTSSSRIAQLGSDLAFFNNTYETERMRLTSTGLDAAASLKIESSTGGELILSSSDTAQAVDQFIAGLAFKTGDESAPSSVPHYAGIKGIAGDIYGNQTLEFYSGRDRYEAGTNPNMVILGDTTGTDGNVGIGTSSPSTKLEVEGTITFGTANSIIADNNLRFKSSGAAYIDHNTVGQDINFRVSNASSLDTTALTIDSSGSLGIGTSPSAPLHVVGSEVLFDNPSGDFTLKLNTNAVSDKNEIIMGDTGTPLAKFGVGGTANDIITGSDGQDFNIGTSGGGRAINFSTNNYASVEMKLDGGNLGIGTTSPDTKLDVQGAIQASESGGDFIRLQTDGNNNIFDINSGAYVFRTSGFAERVRILSTGGLTFNGDTAAANALDDYEEGEWTPTCPNVTLTSAGGHYTKIGNRVWVTFYLQFPTTSNTNAVQVNNLPFTVRNHDSGQNRANGNRGGWTVGYSNSGQELRFLASSGTTTITAHNFGGSAVNNNNVSAKSIYGGGYYEVA